MKMYLNDNSIPVLELIKDGNPNAKHFTVLDFEERRTIFRSPYGAYLRRLSPVEVRDYQKDLDEWCKTVKPAFASSLSTSLEEHSQDS